MDTRKHTPTVTTSRCILCGQEVIKWIYVLWKFSNTYKTLGSVLLSLTLVVWKLTDQVCVRSILCLFVVLVAWLTCLAPVTLTELRSVTLLAGIVNPAGVCDSGYLMSELGSVRLISVWQPTWEAELGSVGYTVGNSRLRPISFCVLSCSGDSEFDPCSTLYV